MIIQPAPFTTRHRDRLIEPARNHGLATIFAFPQPAREGALIGFGPDVIPMYRSAPFYVDRILKGVKPADLPVELPSKFELLVNLTTAKARGLNISDNLLTLADEVIE